MLTPEYSFSVVSRWKRSEVAAATRSRIDSRKRAKDLVTISSASSNRAL